MRWAAAGAAATCRRCGDAGRGGPTYECDARESSGGGGVLRRQNMHGPRPNLAIVTGRSVPNTAARARPGRSPSNSRCGLVHPAHAAARRPPAGAGFSSFFSTIIASVVRSRPAIDAAFCSAVRVTLVGSMTPACDQVLVRVGQRVVAEVLVLRLAHLLDDDRAFAARVLRRSCGRLLERATDDVDADLLVASRRA